MTLISWPIEVGSRELDARLLFGLRCAFHGFSFISGTKSAVTEITKSLNDSAYIHKSAAPKQSHRFATLARSGTTVYAHDEEGLNNSRAGFAHRIGTDTLRHLARYFVFGARQRQELSHMQPAMNAFEVVGHPVYDLVRGRMSGFYDSIARRHRERYGRYFVVAPSHSDENAQQLQARFAREALRAGLIDAVVVKPHPGRSTVFVKGFSEFARADQADPIAPLILGSSGLLHYRSTVAVAASLVDVPAMDFGPNDDRWLSHRLFGAAAIGLDSAQQAFDLAQAAISCPIESGDLLHIDDEPASDRILQAIIADGAEPMGEDRIRRSAIFGVPRLKSLSARGRMKVGNMDPKFIEERLQAMSMSTETRPPTVRFYGDAAFLIHP